MHDYVEIIFLFFFFCLFRIRLGQEMLFNNRRWWPPGINLHEVTKHLKCDISWRRIFNLFALFMILFGQWRLIRKRRLLLHQAFVEGTLLMTVWLCMQTWRNKAPENWYLIVHGVIASCQPLTCLKANHVRH